MSSEGVFNTLATRYDEWFRTPLGEFAQELEFKLLRKHLGNIFGKRILDVGCGTGNHCIWMANLGGHVTGIDPSDEMLSMAKQKVQKSILPIHLHQARAESLPFEDQSFDTLLVSNVLEFVESPLACFKEFQRVLVPGGKLVVGVLNKESLWVKSLKNQPKRNDSVYRDATFFSPFILKQYFLLSQHFSYPNIESCVFVNYHPVLFLEPDALWVEKLRYWTRPLKGAFLVGSARKLSI